MMDYTVRSRRVFTAKRQHMRKINQNPKRKCSFILTRSRSREVLDTKTRIPTKLMSHSPSLKSGYQHLKVLCPCSCDEKKKSLCTDYSLAEVCVCVSFTNKTRRWLDGNR